MKKLLSYSVFCILSILTICGCQQEKSSDADLVQLTIHAPAGTYSEIELRTSEKFTFKDTTLITTKLDSNGIADMKFTITDPVLARFTIDHNQQRLPHYILLTPGDNLEVNIQPTEEWHNLTYSGIGAKVNNYLEQATAIEMQYLYIDGQPKLLLEEKNNFLAKLDSMKDAFAAFHKGYTDTVSLSEEQSSVLEKRNELKVISLYENYERIHYYNNMRNSALSDEVSLEQNMEGKYEVPIDSAFFHNALLSHDYEIALSWMIDLKVVWPLAEKLGILDKETDFPRDSMILISDRVIRNANFPANIQEYSLAQNINNFLVDKMSPGLDTIYNHFKADYSQSEYLSAIENLYDQWMAYAPGKPAPDFTGTTMDGKEVSLSELTGKVVYVDVWATWCGPCIEEFPYSKKLQQQFEGNEEVEFLYVSVDIDRDVEKWKKMVEEKGLKGMHIRDPSMEENSISKVYKISGIPRYILVDQQGKLVNANADRPSTSTIKGEIQNLLNSDAATSG